MLCLGLQELLDLCAKNVFCDAIVFFPNGYSRIGGLHFTPSAWLKSASYSNSTINFGSLIYNPAAVLYLKYNAALTATSLSPEVRFVLILDIFWAYPPGWH
jgi:hypothetical protein